MSARYRTFVMVAALTLVVPRTSTLAQDPLGAAALGGGLDVLAKRVQTIVDKAVGGGMLLEIGAAGQISLLISQAKAAYEADLTLTFDKLTGAEKQTFTSLTSLVADLERKSYRDAAELESRALAISHSLPFSKSLPRLFSYGPTFAAPGNSTVTVKFDGDFTDLVRSGLEPTLEILDSGGGRQIPSRAKANDFVTFDIPLGRLKTSPTQVVANYLQVHVPYMETCLIAWSCAHTAEFRVPITTLPASAGTMTIRYRTSSVGEDKKIVLTAQVYKQESAEDDIRCGDEHADLAIHKALPDLGYVVKKDSVSYQMTWSQGREGRGNDWWLEKNCSEPTVACLCFSTVHQRVGTSGKINFRIRFEESKPVPVDVPGMQTIPLRWSAHQVVTLPTGVVDWSGTFVRFDGKVATFVPPFSDSFVNVTQNMNVITVTTVP